MFSLVTKAKAAGKQKQQQPLMAAHYLDPNVLDPSLRGQQGDDDYSQAFGTHDASDSQHAESSMAAGARRRSKRTREMEPVRGEERNLFGMSREAETV